ncbi:Bacterial regulatory protein, arsR family [Sphaerochaeta pleomorpha str. Grapes]|uniref:Bacterial regulatory protein, arsR family n=1 Tax=Sphaerochaeta pleomorpha (strain ATCC BAA-1885 / DSM 22778 / Grapes) TaxID=158190 RepID=G8QYS7_SPHPG|nr:helix-turn-helix domain-containing protein [Sphaerochaeta pleomorpha]AEV29704.1 Bacterial regulatory protein, arsR family [Sphaerochaeta pleomorpha str. Grapes]
MNTITLTTTEQLKIFMQPTRQKILQLLSVNGPMTPKMVANALEITSSSAKHHILKLVELGIVELDRQQLIHGITATYYRKTLVTVSLGGLQGDEREVVTQNLLKEVQDDFFKKIKDFDQDSGHFSADIKTGVLHLTQSQADHLNEIIESFIEKHEEKNKETIPFVYSLVLYHG